MALITTTDISLYCPYFGQGEEKEQKATIGITKAETKLKGILCDTTYTALVTAVNSSTYPAGYEALYDIVKKYLSWEAFSEYLKWSQVTDTDAGLRLFQEANSVEAGSSKVESYVRNAEDSISLYKAEILQYLEDNLTDFPDYKSSSCRNCNSSKAYTGKVSGAGERRYKRPRTFFKPY